MYYEKLIFWANRAPDTIALCTGTENLTYKTLLDRVDALRNAISSSGMKYEQVGVLIDLSTPSEQLIAFLAYISLGVSVGLLPHSQSETQILEQLLKYKEHFDRIQVIRKQEIKALFDDQSRHADAYDAVGGVRKMTQIVFSSGTGAYCKAALRSTKSWTAAFDYQNDQFRIASGTRVLVAGALAYTGNFNIVLGALYTGGSICIEQTVNPKKIIEQSKHFKPEVAYMVPTVLSLVLRRSHEILRTLHTIVSAGERIGKITLDSILNYESPIRFVEFYGTAELSYISLISDEEKRTCPGAVGKLFPGVELKIQGDEIWVKSPLSACGFEGWQFTGDCGSFHEEMLYIKGRKGDVISKSGKMIDLHEIEQIIEGEVKILRAAAIRISDSKRGENYILALEGILGEGEKSNIRKTVLACLSGPMRPKKIVFTSTFPAKEGGKLDRKALLKALL